jgi:hypothetical protein
MMLILGGLLIARMINLTNYKEIQSAIKIIE